MIVKLLSSLMTESVFVYGHVLNFRVYSISIFQRSSSFVLISLRVPKKTGNLLSSWPTTSFSRTQTDTTIDLL